MTTPTWVLDLYNGSAAITFEVVEDGWQFPTPSDDPEVTQSFRVRLSPGGGEDIFDVLEQVRAIRRYFEQARQFAALKRGATVYLRFKDSAGGDYWQSRVLNGAVDDDPDMLGCGWRGDELVVLVTLTRQNFFELQAEVELPLENDNIAYPDELAYIFNCGDGDGSAPNKRENWVKIAADDVEGDLPAPCRVEIANLDSTRIRNVYLALHALGDPANAALLFEAEDATGKTPVADAGDSGGNYANYTLTDTEANAFLWPLTGAQVEALAGGRFVALIRVHSAVPASTYLRLRLLSNSLTLYEQPHRFTAHTTDRLQVLGSETIQIPPDTVPAGESLAGLTLALTAERDAGGTLALDYLHLLPVLDSVGYGRAGGFYQAAPKNGYGLAQNAALVVDGMSDWPRLRGASRVSGDLVFDYQVGAHNETPLLLQPGRDQYLYALWDDINGAAAISKAATIQAFYRPRRRGL